MIEQVLQRIEELGVSQKTACADIGCTEQTFCGWKRGREPGQMAKKRIEQWLKENK